MRKFTLLFVGALCASVVAFGQLKVQSDGRVVINPSGTVTGTQLTVNTTDKMGLSVNVIPVSNLMGGSFLGIRSYVEGAPTIPVASLNGTVYSAGVTGTSVLTGGSSIAVSFGLVGNGKGSSQGRNVGVFGYLYDPGPKPIFQSIAPYGAGVFGTVDFNKSYRDFTKSYAGFFAGDVGVEGTLTTSVVTQTSDYRSKQNVADVRQAEIDKLVRLNPVEYNFKQSYTEYTDSAGNVEQVGVYDENSQLFQKKHYGLIAQEVQRVYPDLVYEDGDGYLSIDYVGLIPLLISSIKDLKAEVADLKSGGNEFASSNMPPAMAPQQGTETQEATNDRPALYQNTPNPFTDNTEITFYLPQSVTRAMLCVYDMNGKELSQHIITERGNSVFVIHGHKYGAGMYLYSLIADNQIVDTKRMILTK